MCVRTCAQGKLPVCPEFLSSAFPPKHTNTHTHTHTRTPVLHCYPLTDHWHAVSRPCCIVHACVCLCVYVRVRVHVVTDNPPTVSVCQLPFLKELKEGGSVEWGWRECEGLDVSVFVVRGFINKDDLSRSCSGCVWGLWVFFPSPLPLWLLDQVKLMLFWEEEFHLYVFAHTF